MKIYKKYFKSIAVMALLFTGFVTTGIAQDSTSIVDPEIKAPLILTTIPTSGEINVDRGSIIEITFNSDMDGNSINGTTLQLHAIYADTMYEDYSEVLLFNQITDQPVIVKEESENSWQQTTDAIGGTISYSDKVAIFTPNSELKEGTLYTFTVTNGVKSSENIALENDHNWSFTTIGISESTYSDK